jgi:ribosomal protein L44E
VLDFELNAIEFTAKEHTMHAVRNISIEFANEAAAAMRRQERMDKMLDMMFTDKNGKKVRKVGKFTKTAMRRVFVDLLFESQFA